MLTTISLKHPNEWFNQLLRIIGKQTVCTVMRLIICTVNTLLSHSCMLNSLIMKGIIKWTFIN